MNGISFKQMIDSIEGRVEGAKGEYFTRICASWLQGRAAFGGLVAALAVEAMQQALRQTQQQAPPLRAIQVLFSGPVSEGEVSINTQLLRQGRSVTSMRADVLQQGQICCSVMASFGASRPSAIAIDAATRPEVEGPEGFESLPFISGMMPEFLQYFDVRWAAGNHPYSDCHDRKHGIWARLKEPGAAGIAQLIAIADLAPPIPLSMTAELANSSSLNWALEFLSDDWQAETDDWWFIETELAQCSAGYAQQLYKIFSPSGQPLALGQQVMTVFI